MKQINNGVMDTAKKKQTNENPYLTANCINKLCFWWLLDFFWYGKKHHLKAEDIYDVIPEDVSVNLGDKLEKCWEEELINCQKTKKNPSLWKAIFNVFGCTFIKYGFLMLIVNILRIIQPFMLAAFIWYFNPLSTATTGEAYAYGSGLIIVTFLQTVFVRQTHLGLLEIGMRAKVACSSLIYRKVLKLSCLSANQAASGLIFNLLSNDLEKFEQITLLLHYIWIMPVALTMIIYLVWQQLGIAALVGVLFMMIQQIPMQVFWYKVIKNLQAKGATKTDKRILLIGEIINGIHAIKMYAWEKAFEKLVHLARKNEISTFLKRFYVRSVRISINTVTHRIALFFTLLVYVLQDRPMAADKIFSSVQYFAMLRIIVAQFFSESVSVAAQVKVSVKRVEKFLLLEEFKQISRPLGSNNENNIISIKNVQASWEKSTDVCHLSDINIEVSSTKLYVIVGPVGSGKSSLLKLILGELPPKSGEIVVHGNISYVSQEPWLFTGTLRNNILFGEPYIEEKYNRVTKACALTTDFEQLPYGDKTLVGERGASLSGGQCARVSMARAVYRDADIFLFDNPLAAVDSQVSKSLFQDCINGLLKDKARILVTHQVQHLQEANSIILLNSGKVKFQGTYQELQENDQEYLQHLVLPESNKSHIKDSEIAKVLSVPLHQEKMIKSNEMDPRETEELIARGRISKALFFKYFRAGASSFVLSVLILFFFLSQIFVSLFDYWLGFWIKQNEKILKMHINETNGNEPTAEFDVTLVQKYWSNEQALIIYGVLILLIILITNLRNLLFHKILLNAARNIHNKMFSCLVRTPLQFFNLNPAGRIVNRFSKDTGSADESLPSVFLEGVDKIFVTVGIIVQVLIINWWIIFPFLIMFYLFVKINGVYVHSIRGVKRLEGNAKSPVFSLVNSSLLGLVTIRSCRAQKVVSKEFDAKQDNHTATHHLSLFMAGAFGFWLDVTSISLLAFVIYNFIYLKNDDTFGGYIGLTITHLLSICGMLQFAMKQVAEMMAQMASIERMFQYTELDQEGPFESLPDKKVDKTWPNKGELQFRNVYLRYSDEEEPILKDLNFTIEPNMKVGIVGRTGAGKSSIIAAIFRLAKTDGSIIIDNVDTKDIGLFDLRNKISIIPQEPIVFTATLRDNLDLLHQHDDASLWSALNEVELNNVFDSLDCLIDQRGSNLSVGQRQQLCLARAIVKRNKILVLDEATASVDPATDELIQKTIRARFKDCTVLTIAHKLNTIIDSDKILVVDSGKVVEFDEPHVLLQREESHFSKMLLQLDKTTAQHLRTIAEKAYNERSRNNLIISVPDAKEENGKISLQD